MPDISSVFKSEIIRLSKKSVRQHLRPLQAASTTHRRQIANLRKQITALERELSRLRRAASSNAAHRDAPSGAGIRFVAKGLRSRRARLGLSAEEFGKLLGVSAQSVYKWEQRKARPRAAQIAAIAALRGIGKREARARLAAPASRRSPSQK